MKFIHINSEKDVDSIETCKEYIANKKAFVLIYMEYCPPCFRVRPEWKKLENIDCIKKYDDDVAIIDINKDVIKKIDNLHFDLQFFPTIIYITNNGKTIESYKKGRVIDEFVEWIQTTMNNRIKNNFSKDTKRRKRRKTKNKRKRRNERKTRKK